MLLRTGKAALYRVWSETQAGFASIRGSPPDLYKVLLLKVIESYSYFSLSVAMTLYLTDEFGISDLSAGFYYGMWGMLATLYGFLFGGVVDWLGVRTSLMVCFALHTVCRLAMAVTTSRHVLLAVLLGPETLASALGVPVLTIGIKRFTGQGNRGFAFALFYAVMNIAALSVGIVLDFFRVTIKRGLDIASLPPTSLLNNGMRLFILTGAMSSFIGIFASATLSLAEEPETPTPKSKSSDSGDDPQGAVSGRPAMAPMALRLKAAWHVAMQETKVVAANREFWKFLAMCVFTVNLKSIFRHLDATLPKFQIRTFGCDVPVGMVYSVNPFMIIFLVPIVGALTTHANHFDMVHYGGYVSALAPFWIVAFNAEWATVMFVVFVSLGEAIWSPRWYDYSMSVAPEGREGIWTALASAPLFAAKLPTGVISGQLLQTLCPAPGACPAELGTASSISDAGASADAALSEQGGLRRALLAGLTPADEPQPCNGRTLWLIIGLLTLSSPLAILLTQRWVRPAEQPGRSSGDGELLPRHDVWDPGASGASPDSEMAGLLAAADPHRGGQTSAPLAQHAEAIELAEGVTAQSTPQTRGGPDNAALVLSSRRGQLQAT